jgi:hypothetical protein
VRVSGALGAGRPIIPQGKWVGIMVEPGESASMFDESRSDAGPLLRGKMGMLVCIVVSVGLGALGGMLIGRKTGEARGLAVGRELGRMEAAAAMAPPHPWRRFWRRETAA